MKNFNADIIKQITVTALPKVEEKRRRKARREYKNIEKLIYSAAKRGSSSVCINYIPIEPECQQFLKEVGFKVEYIQPSSYRISWD
jgi:hypothetical protein